VAAEAPSDAGIAVGVAAVEKVRIVEILERFIRGAVIRRPFNDFFGPIHPHVVRHRAKIDHLLHAGVPIFVVSRGGDQLSF